jgi:CheY-like chemotaxis protein
VAFSPPTGRTEDCSLRASAFTRTFAVLECMGFAVERSSCVRYGRQRKPYAPAVHSAARVLEDVVVMDVGMPLPNGIDATRKLPAETSDVRVIALSMNADRRYADAMLEAGARGYLLKNSASEELLSALERVIRGGTYLTPRLSVSSSVPPAQAESRPPGPVRPLSPREREVLQLIAEGQVLQRGRSDARHRRDDGRHAPAPAHGKAEFADHRRVDEVRDPRGAHLGRAVAAVEGFELHETGGETAVASRTRLRPRARNERCKSPNKCEHVNCFLLATCSAIA